MMLLKIVTGAILLLATLPVPASAAPELTIGEKRLDSGIVFIFEGAVKDTITPSYLHLAEKHTDIHLEARVNWDKQNIPAGAVAGGFIPYLRIAAHVINQRTGQSSFIDLLPHINLVDNFHYARNMRLPGKRSDKYRVIFNIAPPSVEEVALHKDWVDRYKARLMKRQQLSFSNIDFEQIAKASRR